MALLPNTSLNLLLSGKCLQRNSQIKYHIRYMISRCAYSNIIISLYSSREIDILSYYLIAIYTRVSDVDNHFLIIQVQFKLRRSTFSDSKFVKQGNNFVVLVFQIDLFLRHSLVMEIRQNMSPTNSNPTLMVVNKG